MPNTTSKFTPEEKQSNCAICTLAPAMRLCGHGCNFTPAPKTNGIKFTNLPLMRRIARCNALVRELRNSRETCGKTSALFWEMTSNSHAIPVDIAGKMYIKAGYYAFQGYPLRLFK